MAGLLRITSPTTRIQACSPRTATGWMRGAHPALGRRRWAKNQAAGLALAALLGILLAVPAEGGESIALEGLDRERFRFGGTVKVLGLGYRLPLPGEDATEGTLVTSLRLRFAGEPRRWLGYEAHLRLEDSLFTVPAAAAVPGVTGGGALFRGLGGGSAWAESEHHRLSAEVAYANVRFSHRNADLVIGRQAVTFGRSFFWNPTDWLTSFTPTEIDREYKAGVDAARLSFALGRFSGAELLYAYGEDGERDESALIARAFTNLGGWDLELLGGSVWIDDRLGFAWSGDLAGAGVRGELSWHQPRLGDEEDFLRATLEADYRWPSSLYLILELHHNGWGSTEVEDYAALFGSPRLLTGQVTNVGRHYLASRLSYELNPLTTGSLAVLVNLHDGSGLVHPTYSRSLSDESRLVLGANLPWGPAADAGGLRSEYGAYATTLWMRWQWSF